MAETRNFPQAQFYPISQLPRIITKILVAVAVVIIEEIPVKILAVVKVEDLTAVVEITAIENTTVKITEMIVKIMVEITTIRGQEVTGVVAAAAEVTGMTGVTTTTVVTLAATVAVSLVVAVNLAVAVIRVGGETHHTRNMVVNKVFVPIRGQKL